MEREKESIKCPSTLNGSKLKTKRTIHNHFADMAFYTFTQAHSHKHIHTWVKTRMFCIHKKYS